MRKGKVFLMVALFAMVVMPMQAFEKTIPYKDFEDFQLKINGVKFNNFMVSIKTSFMSSSRNLTASYSAMNKSGGDRNISVSIVGLDSKGKPVWAVDASPDLWMLTKGANSPENDVYCNGDELKRTSSVWIRIIGLE